MRANRYGRRRVNDMSSHQGRDYLKIVSLIPLLVIAGHVLLMVLGDVYTDEGGWLVLYFLLITCIPIFAILYSIGYVLDRVKKKE